MVESNSTQDVLSAHETAVRELDDGSRVIEIEDPDSYRDRLSYRVTTMYGDDVEIDEERRAKLWLDLYDLVGGFKRSEAGSIPTDVVIEGRPAVAAYLYAVRQCETEHVADRLEVSKRTIWDYLSEVRTSGADE